ncbi:MAG: Dabb family protein [Flavobacteriia bacterium]|nr:Dabb family protein [Flavobacteriia bacterium]
MESKQVSAEQIKGDFVHMVFFWLKNPEDQKNLQAFEAALQKFIQTNSQKVKFHIGCPAPTDRPVVDRSYSYCLVVTFPDLETHDAYQSDPTHVLFIEEAKPLWEKVQIYDSIAKA